MSGGQVFSVAFGGDTAVDSPPGGRGGQGGYLDWLEAINLPFGGD